ncbi:MAG TPA: phosphatase PAP2 family protein [Tepidisphaeraceae bacterium]|jgi:membrane-associated phospholipid phosphatase
MRSNRPTLALRFAYALALVAMFVICYGGTNWLTSFRSDVGQLYFGWELKHIPLIPAMIVPYMSVDLLFLAAFFVCRDLPEMKVLARRLATALIVGAMCFLICPLRIGFERPQVDGFFGPIFSLLHGLDNPFNLAPSMHVTIAIILAAMYVLKVKNRILRFVVAGWFVLICVSTLFTWQHHIIDVISGAALGWACLGVVPDRLQSVRKYLAPASAAEGRSDSSTGSSVIESL